MGAKPCGNTALYDAIAVYLSRVEDSSGRKVLVILTDGEDTTSALSLTEVMDLVRSSTVTIYPIAFSGEYLIGTNRSLGSIVPTYLAEMTGGSIFTPARRRICPRSTRGFWTSSRRSTSSASPPTT